jgi:hypothetical protein
MSVSRRLVYVNALVFIGLAMYAVEPVFPAGAEKTVSLTSFTGNSLVLIRSGRVYLFLHPSDIPKGGIALQNSDVIQTSIGVFAELRLKSGRVSISIAENSSLLVENVVKPGNILMFSLIYGRIRAIQKGKANMVIVRVNQSLVEMQKGDVNIDYTVVPGMHYKRPPMIYVSTLSGTAEFIPSIEPPFMYSPTLPGTAEFIPSIESPFMYVPTLPGTAKFIQSIEPPFMYAPTLPGTAKFIQSTEPPFMYVPTLPGTAEFIPSIAPPFVKRIKLKNKETLIFYTQKGLFQKWILDKETAKYWKTKR